MLGDLAAVAALLLSIYSIGRQISREKKHDREAEARRNPNVAVTVSADFVGSSAQLIVKAVNRSEFPIVVVDANATWGDVSSSLPHNNTGEFGHKIDPHDFGVFRLQPLWHLGPDETYQEVPRITTDAEGNVIDPSNVDPDTLDSPLLGQTAVGRVRIASNGRWYESRPTTLFSDDRAPDEL